MKIPELAMPVVEILRRDVNRPEGNWFHVCGLAPRLQDNCPMGLHPFSTKKCPIKANEFAAGECDQQPVTAFWYWWDHLLIGDIEEALDLIWPKETK